jgi:hypothetical protein
MLKKRKPSVPAAETRVVSEVEQMLKKLKKEMEEDRKNRYFEVEEE